MEGLVCGGEGVVDGLEVLGCGPVGGIGFLFVVMCVSGGSFSEKKKKKKREEEVQVVLLL